jgi:hypothetical protein
MNWNCCAASREKTTRTFTFKNGTCVKAHDYAQALEILKSISLRDGTKVFKVEANTWLIDFGKGVSIKVIAEKLTSAKKLGEWAVYLDLRGLELIP